MKILYTNSPVQRRFNYSGLRPSASYMYLGSMLGEQPKLGLKRIDADVRITDVNKIDVKAFEQEINDYGPDIVGTSAYEFNIPEVRTLVETVKKTKPDTSVWLGGQGATMIPRNMLRLTNADAVFRGEADFTNREGVEKYKNGGLRALLEVDGVLIRQGNEIFSGSGSDTIPMPTKQEYEDIEIDFDLVGNMQDRLKYKIIDFPFSRDCPHNCSFCQYSPVNRYRRLSMNKTLELLRKFISLPYVELFAFGDGTFGGGRKGADEIIGAIYENNLYGKVYYSGEFSVEQFLEDGTRYADCEMMRKMIDIGFMAVELGVEHLSTGGLKKYRKSRYTPDEVFDVVRNIRDVGIYTGISLIHIGPDTTADELIEHLQKVLKLYDEFGSDTNIHIGGSEVLRPYAGTEDYEKVMNRMSDDAYKSASMQLLGSSGVMYALPENDEYHYLLSAFIPFDPVIGKAVTELNIIRRACGLEYTGSVNDIFFLLECMKHNADSETEKKLDEIQIPQKFSHLQAQISRIIKRVYLPCKI